MTSETLKKIGIMIFLGILTVSAFLIRLENFKNSQARSIDEIVYYRMAKQVLEEGLSGYNTIPYGQELAATGRELPDYFFQPLFKHPPLFTFLASLSMKLFGKTLVAAFYPSLLFGVLLIYLTYCLGKILYNRTVGLFSAIIIAFDPMSIVCSQKVWQESIQTFFIILTIFFFIKALMSNKQQYFLMMGLAGGLGLLTKYTGGLGIFIIVTYLLLFKKPLFRNIRCVIGLLIPIFFFFPWLIWNLKVYKISGLFEQFLMHTNPKHISQLAIKFALLAFIILCVGLIVHKIKMQIYNMSLEKRTKFLHIIKTRMSILIALMAGFILQDQIFHSFNIVHLPYTSWAGSFFYQSPAYFYLARLIEFSLFNLLGLVFIFLLEKKSVETEKIGKLSLIIILLFFTLWGAFQSRYIISAIPFLSIFSVSFLIFVHDYSNRCQKTSKSWILKLMIVLLVLIGCLKAYHINTMISFPNDLCYF